MPEPLRLPFIAGEAEQILQPLAGSHIDRFVEHPLGQVDHLADRGQTEVSGVRLDINGEGSSATSRSRVTGAS